MTTVTSLPCTAPVSDHEKAALYATVDLRAIAHNYRVIQKQIGRSCLVAPVVKANAYGLGMVPVVRYLVCTEGAQHFCVATVDEGVQLRAAVQDDIHIYVMSGLWTEVCDDVAEARLTPVLSTADQIDTWNAWGVRLKKRLPCWLQVETGMYRLGLQGKETAAFLQNVHTYEGLQLTGVMSHLSCSYDAAHPANKAQQEAFDRVRFQGPKDVVYSFANSGGIALGADYYYDMVRPGLALYGLNIGRFQAQQSWIQQLRSPLTLKARILQITHVPAGTPVGYDQTFFAPHPMRLAVVSCGYADGYARALTNKGVAHIENYPAPVVGRVSMDLITLDVSQVPEGVLQKNAWVTMMDKQHNPCMLAEKANMTPWELLAHLGKRTHFQYIDDEAGA